VLFGLGLPEWLTIIGLLGGLILTFYIMARASVAYEAKRKAREAGSAGSQERNEAGSAGSEERVEQREQENQNAEEESGT
jgi:hypothetical protein